MRAAAGDEFRDLQILVRKSGLLAKQPAYYAWKILLNLVLLVTAFLLVKSFHNPWIELLNAAFLAFVFAQLGFIVHDAGHQEIFSGPIGNEVLGLIHSNLLLGFSDSWWINKHNLHHCSPNHITADPDVEIPLFAFTKDQAVGKRGLARLSVRYQHFCFFPLSLLEAFVLKVDSVRYLMRHKVAHPVIEVNFDPAFVLVLGPAVFSARLVARPVVLRGPADVPGTLSDLDFRSEPPGNAFARWRQGRELLPRAGVDQPEHQEASGDRLRHGRADLPDRTPLVSDHGDEQTARSSKNRQILLRRTWCSVS